MNTLADAIEVELTTSGHIPAGFLFASFKNIGQNDVTVGGVTLPAGEAKGYPFVGKAYNDIEYEIQEGRLRILQVL